MINKLLVSSAIESSKNAYAPYSKYKVGAAILSESGKIYVGSNFENAAFGAGVCAERVALGAALSTGERRFKAICICGESNTITPCGICRQSLIEFGDMDVICCDKSGKYREYRLSDLLPIAFTPAEL